MVCHGSKVVPVNVPVVSLSSYSCLYLVTVATDFVKLHVIYSSLFGPVSGPCPYPSNPPQNGRYEPLQQSYPQGSTILLTCNTGYKSSGTPSLTCRSIGAWTTEQHTCTGTEAYASVATVRVCSQVKGMSMVWQFWASTILFLHDIANMGLFQF